MYHVHLGEYMTRPFVEYDSQISVRMFELLAIDENVTCIFENMICIFENLKGILEIEYI